MATQNAMSGFVDDKMKAMEEEMNRFEQEISGPADDVPDPVTRFLQQARQSHQQNPGIPGLSAPGPPTTSEGPDRRSKAATIHGFVTKPQMLTSVRPEVGPQLPRNFPSNRPAFVPHQVHRGGMPPQHMGGYPQHPGMLPNRGPMAPQMGPVPTMRPSGPIPTMRPHHMGMMPPGGGRMHRPPHGMMGPMRHPMMQPSSAVISAAPTVYAAKPVKFVKKKKETTDKKEAEEPTATTSDEPASKVMAMIPPQVAQSRVEPNPPPPQTMHHHQQPHVPVHPPAPAPYMMQQQNNNPVHNTMQQQQQSMLQQQQSLLPPTDDGFAPDPVASGSGVGADGKKKDNKKRKFVRIAANMTWEDDSLAEWDPNDFRIFCGDLGNEVTDELLAKVFCTYGSFIKAKVVRDKRTNKTKGFGFVSFKDPGDFANAMRELNGKYVGNRPIKLRKSNWRDRNLDQFRKKQKEKQRLGLR